MLFSRASSQEVGVQKYPEQGRCVFMHESSCMVAFLCKTYSEMGDIFYKSEKLTTLPSTSVFQRNAVTAPIKHS